MKSYIGGVDQMTRWRRYLLMGWSIWYDNEAPSVFGLLWHLYIVAKLTPSSCRSLLLLVPSSKNTFLQCKRSCLSNLRVHHNENTHRSTGNSTDPLLLSCPLNDNWQVGTSTCVWMVTSGSHYSFRNTSNVFRNLNKPELATSFMEHVDC